MVHPPTPNDLVYIILLNWGQWELTLACLASLSKLRYSNYRVLVVENGSTNDSAARIQEWIDRQGAATAAGRPAVFTMVRSPTNLGFARGNNLGIAEALRKNADYVWLLNNDTECDEHALSALITCSVRNDAAIVSSNVLLMADPSRSWYQGGWFNPLVATAHHTSFETFERWCPYGTPDEVATAVAAYLDAGCTTVNLVPRAGDPAAAVAGAAEVLNRLRSRGVPAPDPHMEVSQL